MTPGEVLLPLALMLPLTGMLAIAMGGEKRAEPIALATIVATLAIAILLVTEIVSGGEALQVNLGGYAPPLGIALRADGPSAAFIAVSAVVMAGVGWHAIGSFRRAKGEEGRGGRRPFVFWCFLLSIWSALNAVALGQDLFNLYVALELLTFAAVPLVCLDGRHETVAAAIRYLMFALLGSMLYLLGAAILYAEYGALDIATLARTLRAGPATTVAIAVMTAGLLAKAALFPLHVWLPPAHSGAPPAASAVLSALVIKAPFFLILRLWFDVAPHALNIAGAQLLGALGALAVLFCSVLALRQARLKLLIAYSTAAQIGYLFVFFPAAYGTDHPWTTLAGSGAFMQLAAHAFAKAAMFLAAGVIAEAYGHDRIDGIGGFGRTLPITAFALALGGLSLVGLPPSGGFNAKWLLLGGAVEGGHWLLAIVMLVGGLLAAGYILPLLGRALALPDAKTAHRIPRAAELPAFVLALAAIALGLLPLRPLSFLEIGHLVAGVHQP